MRISISVGEYASTPYYFPGLEMTVYCMEELCYLFRENTVLLNPETVMCRELVQWIGDSCGLKELAERLGVMLLEHGEMTEFVGLILDYTGLYPPLLNKEIKLKLHRTTKMTVVEKHKQQVDYLASRGKYKAAVRGYRHLITNFDKMAEAAGQQAGEETLANIWHNLGVAYAGQMLYSHAAESFYKAFSLSGDGAHYEAYLAAKKIELPENKYEAFVASLPDSYEARLGLDRRMIAVQNEWEGSGEKKHLSTRAYYRSSGQLTSYTADSEAILQKLREAYRVLAE